MFLLMKGRTVEVCMVQACLFSLCFYNCWMKDLSFPMKRHWCPQYTFPTMLYIFTVRFIWPCASGHFYEKHCWWSCNQLINPWAFLLIFAYKMTFRNYDYISAWQVEPFLDITSIHHHLKNQNVGKKVPKETKSLAAICLEVLNILLSKVQHPAIDLSLLLLDSL